jgi:hypothetical protein
MKSCSLGFVAFSASSLLATVGASVLPKPTYKARDPEHVYGPLDVELDYEVHRGRLKTRLVN